VDATVALTGPGWAYDMETGTRNSKKVLQTAL